MSKVKANVRSVPDRSPHAVATTDGPVACPPPSYVVIEEQDGAFFLFRYTSNGDCIADTWHISMSEAKAQAEFEYGINESDWSVTNES